MVKFYKILIIVLGLLVISWIYRNELFSLSKFLFKKDKITENPAITTQFPNKKSEIDSFGFKVIDYMLTEGIASTTVSINSCVPDHKNIKIIYGEKVYFKNNSSEVLKLSFPNLPDRLIEPNKTIFVSSIELVSKNRKKGAYSVLSYACNSSKEPTGFIIITD